MENIKETPLCKLAYKYRTDKCPRIKHVYTPFYYELLKDRKKSIKKVLEMGIGFDGTMPHCGDEYKVGASLRMWRDFFPNAQVYGADIAPASIFQDERIETHLCDERKESDIKQLVEKTGSDINLFIDDGLHHYKIQTFLAKTILPLLNDNVTYIIEDISHTRTVARELSEYKCEAPFLKDRKLRHGKLLVITK
jgi:hypothetical protein